MSLKTCGDKLHTSAVNQPNFQFSGFIFATVFLCAVLLSIKNFDLIDMAIDESTDMYEFNISFDFPVTELLCDILYESRDTRVFITRRHPGE